MAYLHPSVKENLKGIKRIIGVYSGKGGVGKTTVAVNLAATLHKQGFRTCLLDADIDCPNVAIALGLSGEPDLDVYDKKIIPLEKHGLKVVSMASFQKDVGEALVWRGPLLTDMLMKFLGETKWGNADYMIVDLPPGTSDVPLTIMKFLKPSGIVIVTTPRMVAMNDAIKSANLAKMTNTKILGVVENMSGSIYGSGNGKKCSMEIGCGFLGSVSFDEIYMNSFDNGYPAVFRHDIATTDFSGLINEFFEAENKILGSNLKPRKGIIGKAHNIALDFKSEILDKYEKVGKDLIKKENKYEKIIENALNNR